MNGGIDEGLRVQPGHTVIIDTLCHLVVGCKGYLQTVALHSRHNITGVQTHHIPHRHISCAEMVKYLNEDRVTLPVYLQELDLRKIIPPDHVGLIEIAPVCSVDLIKNLAVLRQRHRFKLEHISYEYHLNSSERSRVLPIETQGPVHRINQVTSYHRYLIYDDSIYMSYQRDLVRIEGSGLPWPKHSELESEEGMDGLATYIDGSKTCRSEHQEILRDLFLNLLKESGLTSTGLSREKE